MTPHPEIHLESEICRNLAAAGWLREAGDDARYARVQALLVEEAQAANAHSE